MEIYNDWLVSKMTRAELNELSDDERKERLRLQNINKSRKYKEKNPEKIKEHSRKYRENNPEKVKEQTAKYREEHREKYSEYNRQYKQTPAGKKSNKLADWKHSGLQETKEELDIIYDLYLHQELCYSCDCILTRNGDNSQDQACMDHDHTTHKFRQICCRACNSHDNWMQYWC